MAEGIAIDRGIEEGRQRPRRDDVPRQHPAERRPQRQALLPAERRHPAGDQRLGRLHREQRATEGEAVVGKLGHAPAIPTRPPHPPRAAAPDRRSPAYRPAPPRAKWRRGRDIGGDGDDRRILRMDPGLAVGRPVDLDLRMPVALEALDQHEVDRREMPEQLPQLRLHGAAQLGHQRPAVGGGDQDLPRPRLPVDPAVLAGRVHVEAVMRVLDGGDADPARRSAPGSAWPAGWSCRPRSSRRGRSSAPAGLQSAPAALGCGWPMSATACALASSCSTHSA